MRKQYLPLLCALIALSAVRIDAQTSLNTSPSRVLGAPATSVANLNPNFVEGREFYQPVGVAIDKTATPPILYVADSINNRVLAWKNATDGQNGMKADLVIGQRDFVSTIALGPGTALSTGLANPTGLAVDAGGNLWVADSANNRILRFPKPFDQQAQNAEIILPDLVVGQADFSSRAQNNGSTTPNEKGLSLATPARIFRSSLTFDASGNLWVTDGNNNRVLRFPASALTGNAPAADLVIGQADFTTRATGTNAAARINKSLMNIPNGVVIDPTGRLYVADSLARVLVYLPPFTSGMAAGRIAGVISTAAGQPTPPTTPVNQIALGVTTAGAIVAPEGLAIIGGALAVVDPAAHRIGIYPSFDQWPTEAQQFSPSLARVIGQLDFTSGKENAGLAEPTQNTLRAPLALAVNANSDEIYVSDAGNNRVIRLSGPPDFKQPLQIFGQLNFSLRSPNLIEGREFFFFDGYNTIAGLPGNYTNGTSMALDGNRLYVADTFNHRILCFKDVRTLKTGSTADIVIGQQDLYHSLINAPSGDTAIQNDTGLFAPAGVAVDSEGNLFVADLGNARVLRFPKPFEQPAGSFQKANLVLGQTSFTVRITDLTSRNMQRPFGIAIAADGTLAVSDSSSHRVLLFKPASGSFSNGQAAATVIGQADFGSNKLEAGDDRVLATPRGLAFDNEQRLYVADAGKNRIAIFDNAPASGNYPTPVFSIRTVTGATALRQPSAVFVHPTSGEIWVANTPAGQTLRYPIYSQMILNPQINFGITTGIAPLGMIMDRSGALYLADQANRIGIYYPGVTITNGANFIATTGTGARALAPGAYGSLFATGVTLSEETVGFSTIPMPTTLGDTQVLLNGRSVPVSYVSPTQINFLTPNDAPTSGSMEVQVMRASTGQILAAGSIPMGPYAPGLFGNSGNGQLAANNQDGSINSASNPIQRGTIITLYGTGLGNIPGAPPDGDIPGQAIEGPRPRVIIGSGFVPDENVQYSGLAPSLIGVWQINVKVPETVPPGATVPLSVVLGSIPNNAVQPPYNQRTTIAVKQ